MKKTISLIIIFISFASLAGEATGMNGKGLMLLGLMNKEAKGKNVAISYYSIAQVLSMAELGARGDTSAELINGLALQPREFFLKSNKSYSKRRNADILMANKVFMDVHENVLPDYKKGLVDYYGSGLAVVDFFGEPDKSKAEINSFVSKSTKKHIPEFLNDAYDISDAHLFLVNAFYFKSDWLEAFDVAKTHSAIFRNTENNEESTAFMQKNAQMKYLESSRLGCKAVALPYKQSGLYYIAFLPSEVNGTEGLLARLAETDMGALFDKRFKDAKVMLDIPKLKIDSTMSLIPCLTEFGVRKPFTEDADFTGMSPQKPLWIGEVLHAVKLEMDENGTKATAATSVKMVRGDIARLCFDRPFIGMIYDRQSDVILLAIAVNTMAVK